MEPAAKRRKKAPAVTDTDEDELDLEPDELNERRDPAFQLARGRAKAVNTLKSRFEDIFAKYEKDFTGIGDEIDLSTGKVVVDNGHLSSLRDMKEWIVDDEDEESEEEEGEEDTQVEEPAEPTPGLNEEVDGAAPRDPWRVAEPSWTSASQPPHPQSLSSLWEHPVPPMDHDESDFQVAHESSVSVDPAWQAPELPPSAFLGTITSSIGGSKGRHYGSGTPVATRTVLRSSLPAPDNSGADEVDDLQFPPANGVLTNIPVDGRLRKESPLIKEKFPTIGSSPGDNGLIDLIQDVIQNIPDTPPSIRAPRRAKFQGKPSPLGQKPHSKGIARSKLGVPKTSLVDGSREPSKKRGRKPKILLDSTAEEETTSGTPVWDDGDLESYRDVTRLKIKPLGQALYIDIRAVRPTSNDIVAAEGDPGTSKSESGGQIEPAVIGPSASEDLLVQSPKPDGVNVDAALDAQGDSAAVVLKARQPKNPGKSKPQETFTRNIADPDFYFSDEETLLPRRRAKIQHQLEPEKLIHAPPSALPEPVRLIQSNVKADAPAAAKYGESILHQETASSPRQQTTSAAEANGTSPSECPMLVDSTTGLQRSLSLTLDCGPGYISDQTNAVPQTDELLFNPGDAFSNELIPLPSRSKHVLKPDTVDLSRMEVDTFVSAVNEQSTGSLHQGLAGKRSARKHRKRQAEAGNKSSRANTIEFRGKHIPEVIEQETMQRITQGKKESRRSGRLSGKPHVATDNKSPRWKTHLSDPGTQDATAASSRTVSPVVVTATTRRSPHQQDKSPANEVELHTPSPAEKVLLHSEDDVGINPQQSLPRTQESDQLSSQAKRQGRPPTKSRAAAPLAATASQPGKGEQIPTPICERCSKLQKPCDGRSPCRRNGLPASDCVRDGTKLVARGAKSTAQKASLDAEAGPDEALQLSHGPSHTEMAHSAVLSSPAASEPFPPAKPPTIQPATPRRPKSKGTKKPTPSPSFNTSLLSLLSDSEDSEDEISFNHSDFTPSGHHRILAHRRLSQLTSTITTTVTPRLSASARTKKKHAASLLYGRPHPATSSRSSSSSKKTSKTPRSSARSAKETGSERERRRGSSRKLLARSVVRVVRRRDSDGEREGEVVQTPGGTKRRCGVAGWKCDRDFCFVCM